MRRDDDCDLADAIDDRLLPQFKVYDVLHADFNVEFAESYPVGSSAGLPVPPPTRSILHENGGSLTASRYYKSG
jgi:hypothetical protein